MTDLIETPAAVLLGKVYTPVDSDELGTFDAAWGTFTEAGYFAELDERVAMPNRTYLVVFSPYGNIQYWIGSLADPTVTAPKGLETLQLPAATVGSVEAPATTLLTHLPVETTFNQGLAQIEQAGFPLPSHIGQTTNPYYLESYRLTDGAITAVEYRLYINEDELQGVDDYD